MPTDISIDAFDHLGVVEAFGSVGIRKEGLTIRTVTADIGAPGFVNAILTQHLSNRRNGAELCITNVADVYRTLRGEGVPAVLVTPWGSRTCTKFATCCCAIGCAAGRRVRWPFYTFAFNIRKNIGFTARCPFGKWTI